MEMGVASGIMVMQFLSDVFEDFLIESIHRNGRYIHLQQEDMAETVRGKGG